jgi:hypothetical protein
MMPGHYPMMTEGVPRAARLVISARPAETHVRYIMVKLGLTSRAQMAAWLAAQASTDAPDAERAKDTYRIRDPPDAHRQFYRRP